MIKAFRQGDASTGSSPLILIGLSGGNLDRLREGQPIGFPLSDIDSALPPIYVAIIAGETEGAIIDELAAHGLLDDAAVRDLRGHKESEQ